MTKDVIEGSCAVIEGNVEEKLDQNIQYNYKDVKVEKDVKIFGI